MDDAKQQLAEKLKTANNILVTVSRDPSVDQLASCIGLTLLLNKQGKHAAAVFSGNVPSTLEFLQPEETIEKNTDSLRDFIIALDKSKADKLRYKVEDNVVRIFITPYKTSISQADLEFSEGDFNVDLVIALGVQKQDDLDEAITAHGRILHDATVVCINTSAEGGLGSINWNDPAASSLCELIAELANGQLDTQIATALLTGVVAETNRFSNDKTSSQTMSVSAALMSAGANQQLVASKLEETPTGAFESDSGVKLSAVEDDGAMTIDHNATSTEPAPIIDNSSDFELPAPDIDNLPSEVAADAAPALQDGEAHPPKLMTEPPALGGTLTANSKDEALDPSIDPLGLPSQDPPQLLDRKPTDLFADQSSTDSTTSTPSTPTPVDATLPPAPSFSDPLSTAPTQQPPAGDTPATTPPAALGANSYSTLSDLEEAVQSPHVQAEHLDEARDEINQAFNETAATAPEIPSPIQALNAQPLGGDLHPAPDPNPTPMPDAPIPPMPTTTPQSQIPTSLDASQPTVINPTEPANQPDDPNAPPPVPPPIPFQFGNPPQSQ